MFRSLRHRLFSPGAPVVHRALDEGRGTAKTGRIAERVDGDLVVAEWEDEQSRVGFDEREMQRLVRLPLLSRGPVLLYPHHLWNVLKRTLSFARGS